jgi:hypothetical protein
LWCGLEIRWILFNLWSWNVTFEFWIIKHFSLKITFLSNEFKHFVSLKKSRSFLYGEGPRCRRFVRTAVLKLIMRPGDEDD